MIRLHVVQAEYGDCFILESKSGKHSVNVLVDGGPYQTFEKHLKPALRKLLLNGKLDLMVLSHIDNDHIIGLLDLLEEIKNQREKGTKQLIHVEKLWHNSFEDLFQIHDTKKLMDNLLRNQNMVKTNEIMESLVMKGFQQGSDLAKLAKLLKIPINSDFDKLIVVNDKVRSINLDDVTIYILGPTKENIDKLRKEWNNWLRRKTAETLIGHEILDRSIPNLASITFLAKIKNRKILFTGDGIGRDIVNMLSKNAMLDKNGKFHIDILKVPHHGSDRNTTLEFFEIINADYYIISANGRDDNPSPSTLRWIIESGRISSRPKKIILTNITPNTKKILLEYDQIKYNYESIILGSECNFMTISLK